MPTVHPLSAEAPVHRLVDRTIASSRRIPVPLISATHEIEIRGNLASVTVTRTFQNAEVDTIEAALTFPVPVHAVLVSLEARIGGRRLKALAKARELARETYEQAIEDGQTAVLHEELIKGVHLISVGHLAPGASIDIITTLAVPLSSAGGKARLRLRLPMTVGDIYGHSGLPECDDLRTGGPALASDVKVSAPDARRIYINGTSAEDGRHRVWLDQPLVVDVTGDLHRRLTAHAADGRHVCLDITPAASPDANLSAVVLVDTSGSMAEVCSFGSRMTKLDAVLEGLAEAGSALRAADALDVWSFNDRPRHCGSTRSSSWSACLRHIDQPGGGTEIGGALSSVLMESSTRDILLITDGKSHALDVHALARRGARITVVLVGDDSLEANVGHLALLSGGDIFTADKTDIATTVHLALASLRGSAARVVVAPGDGATRRIRTIRGGMAIAAEWSDAPSQGEPMAAAGAFAASLALVTLDEREATELAVAEGLVTHLTSLVLVDVEGGREAGIPLLRKVDLPEPATAHFAAAPCMEMVIDFHASAARATAPPCASSRPAPTVGSRMTGMISRLLSSPWSAPAAPTDDAASADHPAPRKLADAIDWAGQGRRLAEADLAGLPSAIADAIDALAERLDIQRAADRFGLSNRELVVALLARLVSGRSRPASRVARALIGKADKRDVATVARSLGF